MKVKELKTNKIFEAIYCEEADCYVLLQHNKIVNSFSPCTFRVLLYDENYKEYEEIEE